MKQSINEIGDTPAGQWMLGRLAGRQRNREHPEEISSYTMPVRKQGKITKTAIDANTYGDNDYDSAFQRGRDLENSKWRDNYPDYDRYHADEREESLRGFGDAMASMIRHHANKTLKENKKEYNMKTRIKLNEAQLRKVVAESVKKVLKESDINNADFDMSPEAVSMRNRNRSIGDDGLNDAKREFRHILNWVAQSISAMSSVHYGNVNYQHTSFEREEERARQAVEAFHKLLDKVSIEYLD